MRAAALASLIALWAGGLGAQVVANQATRYLFPTAATDARAVWLNPAGPGLVPQASVYLELVVRDPGATGQLRQVSAGFSSRGLSFAYQRDAIDGTAAHTYRLGLGGSSGGLAAGAGVAFYRGGTSAHGWDVGLVYAPSRVFRLGGNVANIGEPEVRGSPQPLTFTPGATLALLGSVIEGSAVARVTRDSVLGYAFGLRVQLARVGAFARVDTDRDLRRTALVFGLGFGREDMIGAVLTALGDARDLDTASLHGVSARALTR